jgi:hypothetical protein
MKLNEVLKQPVKYDLVRTSPNYVYVFHTPNMSIDVNINPCKWPASDVVAEFLIGKLREKQATNNITIDDLKKEYGGVYEITFQPAGSSYFGMTNIHKDMFKIIGTVVQIVKDFVETHHTAELTFVANKKEESRVRLYDRLVHDIPQSVNFTLVEKLDGGDRYHYMLANNDLLEL